MADKVEKDAKQVPKKVERPPLLVTGQLVAAHSGRRYLVERMLGKGGFGEVYQVSVYKDPGKRFAMKVEMKSGQPNTNLRLKVEIHVFDQIVQSKTVDRTHFVKMHDKGMTEKFKYYVMDLVWNSLKDMCQKTLKDTPLSGSTLVGIGRQTLKGIRAMHELGFLHRDIKWQNYAVGLPPMDYLIYIIDFGIARPYREKDGKVKIAREKVRFLGTPRYASIRGLKGEEQGRRDDLESWLYMMLELYSHGNTPWIYTSDFEEIIKLKSGLMQYSQELYKDGKLNIPKTYPKMIDYISQMKYDAEPDYQWCDIALVAGAVAENINPDAPFDWIGKYEEDKKREEQLRKEEEARKIPDKVARDEPSKYSETDHKESRKKDRKKGKSRESGKKKKMKKREGEDETLISMEDMLEDLKKEKKKRSKKKSGERTEDDYWKSDEDNSEDDRSDEDDNDNRGRKKKKKSHKRRSRERTRTREYSDRDDDDGEDDRDTYDKTPHRRRGQKKRSGGRKKASKLSRKKTYKDENIPRIPDPKIPDEESKNVDEVAKKKDENTPCKTPGKTPDTKTPEKEKAQDIKDKDKKESGKMDEKPPVKVVPVEPAKKANEAAHKKEPADAKKK